MFTNPPVDLSFRRVMDDQKILIVNLSKGRLGEDSANLLGALLVTTMGLAALSRADIEEQRRPDYYVLIDEFQSFTTLSVANMVTELRKFRVGLVLANAATIAREFEPVFGPQDLVNLPNHSIYLKLMIDGTPSKPFSATTLRAANSWSIAGESG
jgi:hypothetical protein